MSSSQSIDGPLPGVNLSLRFVRQSAGPLLLACLVVAYAVWLSTVAIPTNVDVSWLLIVCDRLLGGERLNTDILEVNPPFSIWLYMPFMLLEKLVGGRAELWLTLGVVCLCLASLFVSARILTRADPVYRQPRALWAAAVALFMVLCFRPDQFGQREHFALIAVLPWLALQCARQRMPDFATGTLFERIMAGLGAGVVVMVKPPHFALALILPSLCLAFQRRSPKPLFVVENLLGATIATAYVTSIVVFDRAYFSEILPFVREIYLPSRMPLAEMLVDWPKIVLLFAMATALAAGGLKQMHWDVKIPLLTALGFVPAFIIMGKGWPNHALPMAVLGIWAVGIQFLRTIGCHNVAFVRKAAAILGCALALQFAVRSQYAVLSANNDPLAPAIASILGAVEKPTIISIGAQLQLAHPLARRVGGAFVSRSPAAWAVYNAEQLARDAARPEQKHRLEGLRDKMIGEFAHEIAAKKPDIVLYSAYGYPIWDMLEDTRIAAEIQHYDVFYRDPFATVYMRQGLSRHHRLSRQID
ncbi:MAG: hypothetical protein E5W89_15400 [Mesorhizobium sp.]|nr:MAG: hypothetical protein E5W89_15400 [Mesorhizobium sp.]